MCPRSPIFGGHSCGWQDDSFQSRARWGRIISLTKVGLVGAALQLHSLGAALNQEVPHQLVGDVPCKQESVGGEAADGHRDAASFLQC